MKQNKVLFYTENGLFVDKIQKMEKFLLSRGLFDFSFNYFSDFQEFEKKCKELVELIKGPVSAIDSQIKAFEEEETNKKYSELNCSNKEGMIDFNNTIYKRLCN